MDDQRERREGTTHDYPSGNDGNPSWSRDERWIYFDSARTGEQQVWKIPANGGEAIQLTQDGGFAPLESPDGKFLHYVKSVAHYPVEDSRGRGSGHQDSGRLE